MIGIRILIAFTCGANLCLMCLLFQQVGRYFVPRWQMWGLVATGLVVTATIGIANLQFVHRPSTWFTWAIAFGLVGQAAALAALVQWYGSTAGRAHIEAMLAIKSGRKPARTSMERRVDQLLFGVIAVFGIAMFTLLVIGVSSYRSQKAEERTRAALCTFRNDLEQRVTSTQDYLAKHQEATIFGVPRTTLVTNLNNQQRTLESLSGLRCPS